MNHSARHVCTAVAALGVLGAAAPAQQLNDGDFDALAVGTAPDNTAPAGAWQFPASYVTALVGEAAPTDYTIVPTTSFNPPAPGNSLAITMANPTANVHLPNLLTAVINEVPGQVVSVTFRVWVAAPAVGGGSVYIGADMGGGGFSNALDRGPQLTWFPDGTITYATPSPAGPVNTVIVPSYPTGEWQQVRLDIHLDTDTFDMSWAPLSQPLSSVGTGLGFRSGTLNKIDRFTFVHFGATVATDTAYYDNITLEVSAPCYPDCNADGSLTVADFGCFQTEFVAMNPYADCNQDAAFTVADFGCFQTAFVTGCP